MLPASVTTPEQRRLLYYLVCLPLRTGIATAVLVSPFSRAGAYAVGSPLCVVGVSTAVRGLTGTKTGFLGGRVWWNSLRPFHFLTYFLSGLFLLVPPSPGRLQSVSASFLFADVAVSAASSFLLSK